MPAVLRTSSVCVPFTALSGESREAADPSAYHEDNMPQVSPEKYPESASNGALPTTNRARNVPAAELMNSADVYEKEE